MAERHQFKTNNATFYIRKFDVFLSIKVFGDIQRQFLGPIASFMENQDKTRPDSEQIENMIGAIERISKGLDGDTLVLLVKKVLHEEYISVSIDNGAPERLNEGLLNRATNGLGDVVALVIEVIKVNYADLFTRGRDLIGLVPENLANQ